MIRVLENPEFADKLGERAILVQKKYSPDVVNSMWKDYFESL